MSNYKTKIILQFCPYHPTRKNRIVFLQGQQQPNPPKKIVETSAKDTNNNTMHSALLRPNSHQRIKPEKRENIHVDNKNNK